MQGTQRSKNCGTCKISTLCIGDSIEGAANRWLMMCVICREVFIARMGGSRALTRQFVRDAPGQGIAPINLCKEMVRHLDSRQGGYFRWTCTECARDNKRSNWNIVSPVERDS